MWQKLALAAVLSLLAAMFPYGAGVLPAIAASAELTIDDSGRDSLPAPAGGVYEITGSDISVPSSEVETALASGNVVLHATEITVASDIDAPNTNSLSLKATGSIVVNGGVDITSRGGDLIFWSDSDASGSATQAGGTIALLANSSVTSSNGEIVLAGGDDSDSDGVPDGYAFGAIAANTEPWSGAGGSGGTAGIMFKSAAVEAGTGSVVIRGRGTGAASANFQTGVWLESSSIRAGSVTIAGQGSRNTNSGSSNWGVLLLGTTVESPGAIDIEGRGGTATSGSRTNQHGVVMAPPSGTASRVEATGSGSVVISGFGGGAAGVGGGAGIVLYANQTIQSASGDITLEGTSGSLGTFRAVWALGGTSIESSAGDINLVGNDNISSDGGAITIDAASAASGTLNIESPASITQTGAISAAEVAVSGAGSATLTNTSNALGTFAAGTGATRVGSISIFDASGGLTIGQVGSLQGVTASGDVLIETGAGDITLARNISTDSASATAITLNAGKSTAAGTATGGNIVVSGSRTLATGANGIVRLFSGGESASTGLTTLAGGSSNVYYGVDETSTLSPALSAGSTYALYRGDRPAAASSGNSGGSSTGSSVSNPVVPPVTPSVSPPGAGRTPVTPNTNPVPRPVERLGLVFDPDSPSRATIGGAIAILSHTPLGSSAMSMSAGAFEFGVRLNEGNGAEFQMDTPSQSPELFMPRGGAAEMSGKGSYPGSFVQVWLPGKGNDSRELARIPVSSDGTFASSLNFEAGASELPVPIGRQVLQVVSYDEQGNQTVVDMTINIGQGVPAPELNRLVGALPDLSAGASLATSGGIPETVSVTGVPETGTVVVEGNAWVIGVNADSGNGAVENTDGGVLMRLNPSSVGQWSGSGFMPGTLATVWLFSEPTLMTTVTIDEKGNFSSEFLVDARLIAPGEHTLQVQGVGSDGFIKAANLGVLVEQPVELTTESASNMLWWIVGGFLLALFVLSFFIVLRRRRA